MIRVSFPPYEGQPLKQGGTPTLWTQVSSELVGGQLYPGRGLAITWEELIHKPLAQGLHIYRFISYAVTNVECV